MKSKEFSVCVRRSVEEVFAYAANPERLSEWGDGIVESSLTTNGPIGVGSTFVVKNKMGGKVQEFKNKVIAFQPNSKIAFRTEGGAMNYTSERTFEEVGEKTVITEVIDGELSGLMKIAAPLAVGFARRMHFKSLRRLKENLES